MLCFAVYSAGKPASEVDLAGAYLIGTDDVPLRADIAFKGGIITCQKRAPGPAGLALLWPVDGVGSVLLETVRVPERKRPYVLQVELARGRLMRLHQKIEDWGLLEYDEARPLLEQVAAGRNLLIQALQADDPAAAARFGEQALVCAVQAGEQLSRFHAGVLFARRKPTLATAKRTFGCRVGLGQPNEVYVERLRSAFDTATLPIVWRDIEPNEQSFNWKPTDTWVELLARQRVPMRGASLLSFQEANVPDWLYIWEHDFDTIRDLAFEHARRVLARYGQHVQMWDVISGIHADNCFTFNFEQLMELTRMAAALAKKAAPQCTAIVDLIAPWGEYYARNPRTIPPLLYADMVVQSGVNFDAFGLQFFFGPGVDGMFVRDMFQVSTMLDQFAKLGKPLYITAVQVPSGSVGAAEATGAGGTGRAAGGVWHVPWNEEVQAEWVQRFLEIALSKPFVEGVSWQALSDADRGRMPNGGLLRADLAPKRAYEAFLRTRTELRTRPRRPAEETSSPA
ncbi:MAG TPA: endo-1,4-beta-xylanase [Phycisphaerae bacterium]|nr:endo-1,4-beta-xylanase [Phycisphaerae bacterium]HNU46468.1 endo-1,4-beta-xylanase [Phycisphaerae bacterium]